MKNQCHFPETEVPSLVGTETGISVPVQISTGTGTKPNFGPSLIIGASHHHTTKDSKNKRQQKEKIRIGSF
jgi:hypothetical protein